MTTISPDLQRILTDFAHHKLTGGTSSPEYKGLEAALNGSPALVDQLNQAVQSGYVKSFDINPDPNAGASYGNNAINVSINTLKAAASPTNSTDRADLIFQLGHEAQHSFHDQATTQAYGKFYSDSAQVSASNTQVHDYTPALNGILSTNRHDEASAEVAGWNALASHVKQGHPNPTFENIYSASGYAHDFVTKNTSSTPPYTLNSGITLNPDLTMSMTEANIQAMGQHYFDKAPLKTSLGTHGDSDYANYYAAYHVSQVCQSEQNSVRPDSHLTIDMAALKLDERLLEQNGVDLGNPSARCAYYDAANPTVQKHFDHTVDGTHKHTFVPVQPNPVPEPISSLATPPAHASARELFDHMYFSLKTGDEAAFAAAVKTTTQSDLGREMNAQTVSDVAAKDQAMVEQLAQTQALEAQQAEQSVRRGPRM